MKIIITVVEQIISEAHVNIPDGLTQEVIKEEIVARYNSGQMATDFNIAQVDFVSISAKILKTESKEFEATV
ncbi:hypothetical protein [Nostoc parmelioides]|uniref:Trigger factor n=1 Tax=Nostoc parmelioides FACHB-3921 TaxID=2692909 RepID=A0ABR8BSQ2_9NOSO|nr:hypothetical protein [Nostoc parmelioides]MBD2255881.1 hypothetical protein [Nostoc parmelioides FACHB-3921]